MLQKLDDYVPDCLARAADAERRASEATDAKIRADHEHLARAWRRLAQGFQFVESLERFLLDTNRTKNFLERLRPPMCPGCAYEMRLMTIEPDSDNRDRLTFECTDCGHQEARGAVVK